MAAAAYAALRLEMTREFSGAPWKALVAFEAPLPFGHRVLMPMLAAPLVKLGLPLKQIWLATETLATIAFLLALEAAGRAWLPVRFARVSAWVCGFALAYPFLLAHKWPVFYPWDTPALAFTALGIAAVARERGLLACVVVAVAALNRETALIIPAVAIALALGEPDRERRLAWAGLMFVAFAMARIAVALALPDNPGSALHLRVEGSWRVLHNLQWLGDPLHALQWLGSVAFIPLLLVAVWRFIPRAPRRLLLVALAGVLGLTFVGNVYEPRVYGEVLVVSWLPLSLGAWHWLQQSEPPDERATWLRRCDRLAGIGFVVLAGLLAGWLAAC